MKAVFAIKSLAVQGGGAERVLALVTGELAARGHDISVISFDGPGAAPFYDFDRRVQLRFLGIGDVARESRPRELAARVAALRRELIGWRPEVAVGFMHSSYVLLAAAAAGTGIPVAGSEHIVYDHYDHRPAQRAALRVSAHFLAALTAVSEAMLVTFPASVRRKMHVVPNPVPPHGPLADVLAGPMWTILSVGRLEDQKDHTTLIAAFAKLSSRFPEWKLRIVGEGSLRAELERQASTLGLADRVELPGAVRDVSREYSSAHLFVLSSRYESFGLATAEALAHGLPAIGFSDCVGTNEMIRPEFNGLLTDGPDRIASLAAAMEALMGSETRRHAMALAAPGSIAHYSLDAVCDRWERLLRAVVSRELPAS